MMLVAVSIVADIVISLKECLKPRDNVAANTGRKLLKSKRNLNSAQSSGGGKYDCLRHGTLGAEAWQLLSLVLKGIQRGRERTENLCELADPDNENQPSGITIYADREVKEEQEDREIIETNPPPEPERKMTVEFPGINAPIPENADGRLWVAGPLNSNPYREKEGTCQSWIL